MALHQEPVVVVVSIYPFFFVISIRLTFVSIELKMCMHRVIIIIIIGSMFNTVVLCTTCGLYF